MEKAARDLERLIGTVATIRVQRRRLVWAAGGVALAVALLMCFLPGTIARAMPERWHWPEHMAARTLRLDRWDAGERLLATADPERWRAVVLGNRIVQGNRDAILACLRTAGRESKSARCIIKIEIPNQVIK